MNLAYMSDKEKRKHFEEINWKNLNAKKKSKCMYKGCNRFSIDSHAVSRNYHIKQIAENNVVMSFVPRRNARTKELILNEVGVNIASVFQGFCKDHDNIFKSVDTKGIRTKEDLLLQSYRSVCFWFHMLTIDGRMMEEIQKDVDDTARAIVEKCVPTFNYDAFRFGEKYQQKKRNFTSLIKDAKEVLENALEQEYVLEELGNNEMMLIGDIEIYFCRVDEKIPVILNTMNTIAQGGNLFHIVLPNKDTTDIIVINVSNRKIDVEKAWINSTSNMLYVIDLIETWMIASETWYIKPSVIKKIPEERLNIISQDIRYWQGESQGWQRYDMSIFDDLRLKYIALYKQENRLSEEVEKNEMSKFVLQERLPQEEREKNMERHFIELQFYGEFC